MLSIIVVTMPCSIIVMVNYTKIITFTISLDFFIYNLSDTLKSIILCVANSVLVRLVLSIFGSTANLNPHKLQVTDFLVPSYWKYGLA